MNDLQDEFAEDLAQTPVPSDTISILDSMCAAFKATSDEYDALKAKLSELNAEYERQEFDLINKLEAVNKTDWSIPGYTFKRDIRYSYKVPKTDQEKIEFFNYAEARGVKMQLMSVNSISLNSWVKGELKLREMNNDPSTSIPGLGAPTGTKKIKITK